MRKFRASSSVKKGDNQVLDESDKFKRKVDAFNKAQHRKKIEAATVEKKDNLKHLEQVIHEEIKEAGVEENPPSFTGCARVFFQGRKDDMAHQLTNCSNKEGVTYDDTYLHIKIDSSSKTLLIFGNEKDYQESRLLVDPPIDLRYFFAMKVPESRCGIALFLKDDDRYFRRFIFRFEFYNGCVRHDQFRLKQLYYCGAAIKKSSRAKLVARKFFASSDDERLNNIRITESESMNLNLAYMDAIDNLIKDASQQANSFVEIVNQLHLKNDSVDSYDVTETADDDSIINKTQCSWGNNYDLEWNH